MTTEKNEVAAAREKKRILYLSRPYEATGFCNGCRSCEMACSLEKEGVFEGYREVLGHGKEYLEVFLGISVGLRAVEADPAPEAGDLTDETGQIRD